MRLSLDNRALRVIRRLPRTTIYTLGEVLLLTILAVQCARLIWAVVTPVGPLGDWRGDAGMPVIATPDPSLFSQFDPFFRLKGADTVVVTNLDLTLYGIREDTSSGRGAAIIATPDGEQQSYTVGEEIMPGVVLYAVDFDSVTIDRNGAREQLYLDQSPAPPAASRPSGAQSSSAQPARQTPPPRPNQSRQSPAAGAAPSAQDLARAVQISPRREGSRLTGLILQPTDDGTVLSNAGLRAGDIVLSINGQPVSDMGQASNFATQLRSGNAEVQVERNGETITVRPRFGQ